MEPISAMRAREMRSCAQCLDLIARAVVMGESEVQGVPIEVALKNVAKALRTGAGS